MLPERELPLRVTDSEAFFDFLGPQDEPWLQVLLREMQRFEGRRWRELAERLAEPLPCQAPHFKRRCATRVLARLWRRENIAVAPPPDLRARVFAAAAATRAPATDILTAVAADLGLDQAALLESLFADLPPERRVRAPATPPGPAELALRTNLAVTQAALMRASRIALRVRGAARPIVRLAKLQGLLCVVKQTTPDTEPVLDISGPFSLFRHTLLYGRALAALLPHLVWCAHFELRAQALLWGRITDVTLQSGVPIFAPAPPVPFDSRLEQRFADDFERLAPDWHLIREPVPLRAGGTLIFPDFLVEHRIHPQRRVLVEIVGFWTPEYLASKLAHLRQVSADKLIVCLDEERACAPGDLPAEFSVVRDRRRIDASAVLREVERMTGLQESAGSRQPVA